MGERRANGGVEGGGRQHRQCQTGGRDAPPLQPRAQGDSPFFQPPLQRADRAADLFGGFVAGAAGEIAQQERQAQTLGQALQLLVEGGSHLVRRPDRFRPWAAPGSGACSIGTARRLRARAAMRHVVVYSQLGTDCPRRIDFASRARLKNAA